MKKLLFLLFLIPSLCSAAITQLIVIHNIGSDESFSVQAYGINSDGSFKQVTIKGSDIAASKVKSFYGHFSLDRDVLRYFVYYSGSSANNINFQLYNPYENLPLKPMQSNAQSDLTTLENFVINAIP